ncbi:MAG: hypothetical protein ACI9U2_000902 [Bradymonadia bacterium]|jgi:hypothetical protein
MTWRGRAVAGRLNVCVAWFALGCTDGVQQVEPVDCDPITDVGCAGGTHCRLLAAGERACLALGAPTEAGCAPGNCAAGEACVVVEGRQACRTACAVAAAADGCAEGTCGYALADGPWGVCLQPCTLGDCGADATCAPIAAARHPICVATGAAEAGMPCTQTRCASGLGCLLRDDEPRCTPLCRSGMNVDCPSGSCVGIIRNSEWLQYCDG